MSRGHQDELRINRVQERDFIGSCLRSHHTMVCYRKCLYIFGGCEGEVGGQQSALWKFSTDKYRWASVTSPQGKKQSRREGHSAVIYRNGMYVYGGHRGVSFYSDLQRFDFDTRLWTKMDEQLCSTSPVARFGHAAVVARERMWVIGGFLKEDNSDCLVSYSFAWGTWSHHDTPPYLHGNAHTKPAVAVVDDNLVIVGLFPETDRSSDVVIFNIEHETWKEVTPKSPFRLDNVSPWCQQYAHSVYHQKTKKLLVFFYKSKKKTSSTGSDWAMLPRMMTLDLSNLNDIRWNGVVTDGVKLPKVVPASDYNVKFATCCAGDKIFINGGVPLSERIMFVMSLTDGIQQFDSLGEGHPRHSFSFTPSMEKSRSRVSFCHLEGSRRRQSNAKHPVVSRRPDDEGFCVPFSKEIVFPSTVAVDSTTPVVRLRTHEEIRQWEESAYNQQKKWLIEVWDDCKHDDLRRKEAEKSVAKEELKYEIKKKKPVSSGQASTLSDNNYLDCDNEPAANALDDDILNWKMGRSIIIERSQISDESKILIDVDEVGRVLGHWDAVKKCIVGCTKFINATKDTIHRMHRASVVAAHSVEDLSPNAVPTRRKSSVASVMSTCSEHSLASSPSSSRPCSRVGSLGGSIDSHVRRRGRRKQVTEDLPFCLSRLQDIKEVKTSIKKSWQSLEHCGLVPKPPSGSELQHCVTMSATTRDPHLPNTNR